MTGWLVSGNGERWRQISGTNWYRNLTRGDCEMRRDLIQELYGIVEEH